MLLIRKISSPFTAFLSAAEIPISDEQKSAEIKSTLSSLEVSSKANETVVMSQSVESTSSNSSENASVEGSSPSDTLPPLVFPAEEDKFLPKNDTALKILQEVSGKPLEVIHKITISVIDIWINVCLLLFS